MGEAMIELPPAVRRKAARLGERGARWLDELPGVVAGLRRAWAITDVGPALPGGTAAYVARVRVGGPDGGRDAVVKIALPAHGGAAQIRTIAAAHGRGYVRLLAHDAARRAMLQEALGPPMDELGLPPEQMIAALCRTLGQAWGVPPDPAAGPAPDKAGELGRLVQRLWDRLGRPCPERVVRQALRFAGRRAAASGPGRCVVVHGDPHPGNALSVPSPRAGAESGFVFVDPDGFAADPAYDLGVVLRGWCAELLAARDPAALARRYCALLASGSGLEETAIWEWGYLERVSSGLYCLDLGLDDLARPFLATAEMLAGS
ncbi:aminoglycoside phosphotransferase family protein [Actinomadura sp. 7K507]|uniref:aminoglycoside phosphotransferase family protein n=1 Tax=Actinomadura sp. 7K507 TaxID=2530365 RepID=UPI001043F867|nr:aminoglycoside phosphotransferase family protein [Actinomadura sp. 7K507]TDC76155.1 aminoglycoside phosphotransferase [Actinomadura sp. 7K507]